MMDVEVPPDYSFEDIQTNNDKKIYIKAKHLPWPG
jgi:hypothetical protein